MTQRLSFAFILPCSFLLLCEGLQAQWVEPKPHKPSKSLGSLSSREIDGVTTRTQVYFELSETYAKRPAPLPTKYVVDWKDSSIDPLGNRVAIRGTLKTAGPESAPVNWFQGITVCLAMIPEWKADWSAGYDLTNTLASNVHLKPTGEFQAIFELNYLQHDHRESFVSYQVGVALAKHSEDTNRAQVKWTSSAPVIPATIRQVRIPKTPALSSPLCLVNAACRSTTTGSDYVRAVNALRILGKDKALKVLEEYLQMKGPNSEDHFGVFWIIRLLFEPENQSEQIPIPAIWVRGPRQNQWPLTPMALVFDVPFQFRYPVAFGGAPERPVSHIRWARDKGTICVGTLTPIDPLSAAEFMIRGTRFKAIKDYQRQTSAINIRAQAIRMLELDSMPGVDRKLKARLQELLVTPYKSLSEPFPPEVRKRFKWNRKQNRFLPRAQTATDQ